MSLEESNKCPILVISLKESPRREFMINECKKTSHPMIFIDAQTPTSPMTQKMGKGINFNEPRFQGSNRGLEISVFASHIARFKYMVENDIQEAICSEDDAALHFDFDNLFNQVRNQLSPDTDLVYLSCLGDRPRGPQAEPIPDLDKIDDIKSFLNDQVTLHHRKNSTIIWGAVMYWIKLSYAKKLIHIFDRELLTTRFNPNILTSELISCCTIPLVCDPFLAIEFPLFMSTMRNKDIVPEYLQHGYHRYCSKEIVNYIKNGHIDIDENTSLDVLFHVIKRGNYNDSNREKIIDIFNRFMDDEELKPRCETIIRTNIPCFLKLMTS